VGRAPDRRLVALQLVGGLAVGGLGWAAPCALGAEPVTGLGQGAPEPAIP